MTTTLKILSGGAANGLVSALEGEFTAATGLTIDGEFGAVGGMRDRVVAGEAVDVVILTRAIIDQLAGDGHIVASSAADLGEVVTGVAVPDGAPHVDVSTPEALAAAVAQAHALHVPDTTKSTAGRHVAGVLDKLEISAKVGAWLKEYPNGQTAMAEMANAGSGTLGITQITEVLNTPGVRYVGALPEPHGLSTTYTAAVCTNAADPDAAQTLVAILSCHSHSAVRKKVGIN